ncbi:FprA family A-type flavoprotein [Haloplasma contractile]|uniref:Flavo-diiron protein FprA1 n=1 Tax=Haloplasma contractile SSD-17B TaxID=1033810 RepID=U2EEH4_9MOLU|nr:FprA family A-type flavoprotein [Haloplasma contractile]ERJ13378.1 Flavo-diiron protein FprA1 [Haloplasma contractile SSD-17B]
MHKQIKENIHFIGVLDREIEVFDVVMETEFGTSYNSYLIKGKEKNAIVETVKDRFFDEYLNNINELVGGIENIDYVIMDHTEPDHAGSLEKLLELNPNIEVVGSRAAILYLKDITNMEFKSRVVKQNDTLSLGDKTFRFISAPFLHWPDSIYTYLEEDNTLFTCDSFGCHYAHDGIFISELDAKEQIDFIFALKYYFNAIFSPFKKFLLQAVAKIETLDIDIIAPGHGPVFDVKSEAQQIINFYQSWAEDYNQHVDYETMNGRTEKPYDKLVVIPYSTSYGYTETMAMKIVEGIKSFEEDIEVKLYNLNVKNFGDLKAEIMEHIFFADSVLFGSTTINKDATPVIWDIATAMNPIVHNGKICTAFGSFGWSGEGVDFIFERLKSLGMKMIPALKLKFKPSEEQYNELIQYGKMVAESIFAKESKFEQYESGNGIICKKK